MCLLAFAWRPDTAVPLRLAGNRDERHDRPTAPLHYWEDHPDVLGGRDLEAGGSWLAAARGGRVAALTNVRNPSIPTPANAPSRGELVASALQCSDIDAWLAQLKHKAYDYAGFNLLVATPERLWHLHRGRQATLATVTPGVYGLSNADLDTPWPKLCAVREALHHNVTGNWQHATGRALHDVKQAPDSQLPDTGVGIALERQLSAAFIMGETYGTRATTWLTLDSQGQVEIIEQRFGPLGRFEGETTLSI